MILTEPDLPSFLKLAELDFKPPRESGFYRFHRGHIGQVEVGVAGPALGAPQACLIAEKLIALGAGSIISFGWCGSLQSHLPVGTVVVPTEAIPEDGVSYHYPVGHKRPFASKSLVSAITRKLEESGIPHVAGTVWTTDAPFRETKRKVHLMEKSGVLAVDMEAAGLFSVALFRRVRAASIMVVSDELVRDRWRHGFDTTEFAEARHQALRAVFEITADLLKTD